MARATTEQFVTWLCDVIDLAYEYYGVISIRDLYEIFKQNPSIEGVKIIKEASSTEAAGSSTSETTALSETAEEVLSADVLSEYRDYILSEDDAEDEDGQSREDDGEDWEDALSEDKEDTEDSEDGFRAIENLDEFTDMVHHVLSINEEAKGKILCRIDGDDVVSSGMSKDDIDYIRSEMKLCGIEHSYIPTFEEVLQISYIGYITSPASEKLEKYLISKGKDIEEARDIICRAAMKFNFGAYLNVGIQEILDQLKDIKEFNGGEKTAMREIGKITELVNKFYNTVGRRERGGWSPEKLRINSGLDFRKRMMAGLATDAGDYFMENLMGGMAGGFGNGSRPATSNKIPRNAHAHAEAVRSINIAVVRDCKKKI